MLSVLIVDDEGKTRKGLDQKVNWSKFWIDQIYDSRNADEALGIACRIKPDIILSDVEMPGMNGFEMCQKIRQVHRDCQIVFFDGYFDKKNIKEAMSLEAAGYVEKPIRIDEVEEALFRAASRRIEEKRRNEKMHRLMVENRTLTMKRLVEKLCTSEIKLKDVQADFKRIKMDWSQKKCFSVLLLNQRNAHDDQWMSRLTKFLQQQRKDDVSVIFEQQDEEKVTVICACKDTVQMQKFTKDIYAQIKGAAADGVTFDISVGEEVNEMSQVCRSCRSAQNKMWQMCYAPELEIVSPEGKVVLNCAAYIQTNYGKADLSLDKLAKNVYLSPNYLSGLFRKKMGMTIIQYITDVRIAHAKNLLEDHSLKVYDVAYQSGYKDANYFAKIFRKMVGMSPLEYRAKHCA